MNQLIGKPLLGQGINWNHPLSRDLVGCWLFNEGGGDLIYNLADYNIARFYSTSPPLFHGDYLYCNQSNALYNNVYPFNIEYTQPFSIYVSFVYYSVGDWGWFIGNGTTPDTFKGWSLYSWQTSASPTVMISSDVSTDKYLQASQESLSWNIINIRQDFMVTYNGNGVISGLRMYKAGTETVVYERRNSLAGNSSIASTPASLFSDVNRRTVVFHNGRIYYIYMWLRELNPSEVQHLYVDPYCFIQPIRSAWLKQYAAAGIPKHWDYYRQMRARA